MKTRISNRVNKLARQSEAKAIAAFYCSDEFIYEAKPQEATPDTDQQALNAVMAECLGYDGTIN
jgi:hypothetical protein